MLACFDGQTAERRSPCFNQTQDNGERNWAPSWPYETARVLTGLANFLIDYPKLQSAGANFNAETFVDLLRTYAQSHTPTRQEPTEAPAASHNRPWVGENIEPDKVRVAIRSSAHPHCIIDH